jgi:hypothetical protein
MTKNEKWEKIYGDGRARGQKVFVEVGGRKAGGVAMGLK